MWAKYLLVLCFVCIAQTVDLQISEITIVTDETRFTTLHPDVELVEFDKMTYVKGKYLFRIGERITGDRLILHHLDEAQFTKYEDIEVFLNYPRKGQTGSTLTAVEVYVDLSSEADADAYFTDGGIDHTFASILLTCDRTTHYTYEIFIYGY